jgi:hypothetical protein
MFIPATAQQFDTKIYNHIASLLTHQWGHKQPQEAWGRIHENEDDILR